MGDAGSHQPHGGELRYPARTVQPCRSPFPAQAPRLAKENADAVGAVTLCDIARENPI